MGLDCSKLCIYSLRVEFQDSRAPVSTCIGRDPRLFADGDNGVQECTCKFVPITHFGYFEWL